ncbi:MAG: hypothetical protein B9S30_08000 [Verrucomicrobiia bacterium Tous-C5FEB]|nr:MAG: hypothetical protein B9S30_08000 [Verrucomicrobiae bacterium Tous-C5FEB]
MKPYLYSLIAAAAFTGLASAQTTYTTPVGYTTTTPIAPNKFNLVSFTVHNTTIAAGVIDAESASSITDNEVNFTTLLGAADAPNTPTYILELPNGVIQEVVTWAGSVLTTPQDITASVTTGTTTYKLRKAKTISEIFGATNSAGITASVDGDLVTVDEDTIQVYNGAGFDVIYYFNNGLAGEDNVQGWFDANGNPAAAYPIVYSDGLFIRRGAGTSYNLVVTGEIKTKPTSGVLVNGFNYLGAVAPVGLTLQQSGLQNSITQSPDGDLLTSDQVQIQNPDGSFLNCYYFNNGLAGEDNVQGWFDQDNADASGYTLDSGFLILNRGGTKPYTIAVPTSYNNL